MYDSTYSYDPWSLGLVMHLTYKFWHWHYIVIYIFIKLYIRRLNSNQKQNIYNKFNENDVARWKNEIGFTGMNKRPEQGHHINLILFF